MYFRVPKRYTRRPKGKIGLSSHQVGVYVTFLQTAMAYSRREGRSCLVRHHAIYIRYRRRSDGQVVNEPYLSARDAGIRP